MPKTEDCGDEAALLHELAPQAWIGVGYQRLRQFRQVARQLGKPADITIIDDGFQNWRFKKDVELLTVTSSARSERLFREWRGATVHADLVVWTKGKVKPRDFGRPSIRVDYQLPLSPEERPPIWLVTGVGDGGHVAETAKEAGFSLRKHYQFPDHARYNRNFVEDLLEDAQAADCQVAVTGKDWVKWRELLPESEHPKILVFEPQISFEASDKQLWEQTLWGY